MRQSVLSEFCTFAAIGATGTVGQYLILIFLVQQMSINPVWASCVGFIVGALINYILNYKITFRSKKKHLEASIKFFTIALIGLCLNTVLMTIFIKKFKFFYLLAQIVVTFVVLLWNFTGNKFWTFKV